MAKEKKKMGRPTKYNPKYCKELLDYFDVEPYTINELGQRVANDLPTFAGFAWKIGVHRFTLNIWLEKYPDFFDSYKLAKEKQEHMLATNGLQNLYAQTFAIFAAKNITSWRDKKEFDHTTNGESIAPKVVSEIVPYVATETEAEGGN